MVVSDTIRYAAGMGVATAFSLAYILAPVYIFAVIILVVMQPKVATTYIFSLPLIISAIIPPIKAKTFLHSYWVKCILDYFDYEEIFEVDDEKLLEMVENRKNTVGGGCGSFIFAAQPHGVLSFGGICAGINADPRFNDIATAAAGAVMKTPVVKHVIGLFELVDASAKTLKKRLWKGGMSGTTVLYPGGIAELFMCSDDEEVLYLQERKGFIKLALREGADIVPLYFIGNTASLSIPKVPFLETLSRKYQVSITIFWGRWGLPIPRPDKIIYVRGTPLGLPFIPEPTDADVEKWHAKYVSEVIRLFDKYKGRSVQYKNRKLTVK